MAPSRLRAVLFDLDGTLVQTRESSWLVFEKVNKEFSLGIDDREQYYDLFRGNLFEVLPRVIDDKARSKEVLDRFLHLLRLEYEPLMVPGMVDVIQMLAKDHVLGVISSNALTAISRIIVKAGLENSIAHIFGGDVVPDKRDAIRTFYSDPCYATLRQGEPNYFEVEPSLLKPDEIVFVTDTVGDIRHAKECGVRTIAVTWGLHTKDALAAAQPDMIVNWPLEIVAYVRESQSSSRSGLSEIINPNAGGEIDQ